MVNVFMWKRKSKGQSEHSGVNLIMTVVLALVFFSAVILAVWLIYVNCTDTAFPDIFKKFGGA
ncbi:MAG: hypothetical protein U9Q92_04455, partial [archaeon]|nr:hypothetical protein [archaeon]